MTRNPNPDPATSGRTPPPWWFVLIAFAAGALSFAAVTAVMWYRANRPPSTGGPAFVMPPAAPSPFGQGQRPPAPTDLASVDDRAATSRCLTNLRRIAAGLQAYANRHDWRLPDRLEDLAAEGYLSPAALVCPWAAPPSATSPADSHRSYTYLGKGMSVPIHPDTIVLYEPVRHYSGGAMHALFGDGGVRTLSGDDARQLLADAAGGVRPLQYPATRPGAGDGKGS